MTRVEPRDQDASQLALAGALTDLLLADFALRREGRSVIAVAGESGSGKSTTAIALAEALTNAGLPAHVLHQDDYFVRPPRANHNFRCRDLANVGMHEVNLALLAEHIAAFRGARHDVTGPRVDYPSDSFHTRPLDFSAASVLLVEGTYVLHLDDVDVRIFLEATHEQTAERRLLRNRDVHAPIIDRILAIEHEIIAQQATRAQIRIDPAFVIRR